LVAEVLGEAGCTPARAQVIGSDQSISHLRSGDAKHRRTDTGMEADANGPTAGRRDPRL
jgi:hypothetical protein